MTTRHTRFLLLGAGLLALSATAMTLSAQQARPATPTDDAMFQGLKYRSVGPSRGGRVTAVTGVPTQPATFYMGVASGGVFRTTNSGQSWEPITDGQMPLGSVGAIAVADSDPNTIYVGTGSDGVRSNVSTGRGVYKSTDAGKTWTFAGLYNAGQIGAVRIHPGNPNIVWLSATGDIFKANSERGVFKTVDGGRNWKKVLFISDDIGAMDVEIQPGNPNVIYTWMSRLERKPWTIISGGKVGGFYKSTDAGETFTKIATGLPQGLIGKANLAVTAANPNRIYALIEAEPGGGFYRSDDGGQTWANTGAPAATQAGMIQRPFYYTTLGADQTNADVVYGGAEGFYKSTDAGKTFQTMRTPHGDNHDIWVNPTNGQIMIQSNDGGANVSTDGGRTWSTQSNQPTGEFYGAEVDKEFPYNIYGAQQDDSTLYFSYDSDPYAMDFKGGPGCETGPIIPHPIKPNIIYGSCKGQYAVMNTKTGQTKNYWIGGQSLYGNDGGDLIYRFQRVSPMALSPHDPLVIYYGSQYLHRSRDLGVTWEKISPDLTAFPPCCQGGSGEPITRDVTGEEFYSTLYAITESALEPGVIWTGSNDGPFHITRDNGKTWKNVTPKDLPTGGRVAWIDASAHRKGSAYFAVYRYLLGDYQPYIYRTDDYGATWKRLTDGKNGIPADWPTRVVREDPDRAGLLYAGTEFGMFISFDNGATWKSFQLNMPNVPINQITLNKKDMIVATQGRAFWIFDNLSPLQQLAAPGTPVTAPAAPKLFKPRDGYRTRTSPETLGPTLDYYLPAAPEGHVTIDILDAKGQVVNSYSSATPAGAGAGRGGRGGRGGGAPAAPIDPDAPMMAGRTAPANAQPVNRVTRTAGFNRFVWDVRHQNGLPMAPGQYQARVKVGDATLTESFNVLIDPNVAEDGVTAADLQEQFDHGVKMNALVASVNQTVAKVRTAQTQFANDPVKLKQVNALADKLNTQPIRYGRPGLQAHIQYIARLGLGVDQKVGRDAIERYGVLKAELDKIIEELNGIVR
ncbi:MAG TPA: hypothetical protein VMZ90_00735 [Vicinamibacterales bacterium]|nr:hypothetical protein [Vicinamibacterales bacterium]